MCSSNGSLLHRKSLNMGPIIYKYISKYVSIFLKFPKLCVFLCLKICLYFKDRIHFKILLLTYKAVLGHAPAYIRDLISFTTLRSLRSASQLALKPGPRSKTSSYGDRAFPVAAPKLWNNIPYNMRSVASIGQFKTQLKTFLFN